MQVIFFLHNFFLSKQKYNNYCKINAKPHKNRLFFLNRYSCSVPCTKKPQIIVLKNEQISLQIEAT